MSMRITTSMVQRNVLADLNSINEKLTRMQLKSASGKEISRPSDDPFHASQAMAMRQSLEATRADANAEALTNAVGDRRESIAGVSLDEEMTNLVRFQRAYQASARAMSTMDEMLDVLINRTGRVGL